MSLRLDAKCLPERTATNVYRLARMAQVFNNNYVRARCAQEAKESELTREVGLKRGRLAARHGKVPATVLAL